MAEYIEREALKEKFRHILVVGNDGIMQRIDEEPTADVVEVRHGEWNDNGMIKTGGLTECHPVVRCSECEIVFCDLINNHRVMFHYCPNCGAKMDGKGEGE